MSGMKLRCERDTLLDGLAVVSRAVASRGDGRMALSGVKFTLAGDELALTGTDLDLTISVRIEVSGQGDGEALPPGRLATDIVRSLDPGTVEMNVDEDRVHIVSGRSHFSVQALPVDQFPRPPEVAGSQVDVESAPLAEAVGQVARAAGVNDAQPILRGINISSEGDGIRLVAVDGYRLAIRDLPGINVLDEGQSVLVPSRSLTELMRLLPRAETVSLGLGERVASFTVGTAEVVTRLIEGEFPSYRQLIPASLPCRLVVGRESLLQALGRVQLLARDSTPVKLTMHPDRVEVSAVSTDVGEVSEDLDATYEGEERTIAFRAEWLVAAVDAFTSEEVELGMEAELGLVKPAVIRAPGIKDHLQLLMPVRTT